MGGLKSLFTKLIPIMLLICFLCVGITHTFGSYNAETGESNITYLSKETYNIGTEQNPEEFTYYEMDVNGYMTGIRDTDVLHRSVNNSIDITTYTSLLDYFSEIWENGYYFGAITESIVNSVVIAIDTIILAINVLIIPIRIICGTLLTIFALVGIKTNNNGAITTTLNVLLDNLAIKMIIPTYMSDEGFTDPNELHDQIWQFKSAQELEELRWNQEASKQYVNFASHGYNYIAFEIGNRQHKYIKYFWLDANQQEQTGFVYENGQWLDQQYRTIQIGNTDNLTSSQADVILGYLIYYGNQIS